MNAATNLSDVYTNDRPWMARAARLLEVAESSAAGGTGALVLSADDGPRGSILVEEGRICWIAARGLHRRLSDLLTEQAHGLGPETVEDVFAWCSKNGQPLGEALVQSGLVAADGLRTALERHSAESLLALAKNSLELSPDWVPHKRRRYDARFTFSAAELWVAAGESRHAELARVAAVHLARVVRNGAAAAFLRSDDATLCVASVGTSSWSLGHLTRLASHASLAVDLCDFVLPGHTAIASGQAAGGSVLTWRHRGMLFVAVGAEATLLPLKAATISGTLALLDES